ncbi:hypothetical protein CK477_20760 [Enterobacter cloacae]|nr:hypothetical protein CK477_20760 [Enterobacter cloacae]
MTTRFVSAELNVCFFCDAPFVANAAQGFDVSLAVESPPRLRTFNQKIFRGCFLCLRHLRVPAVHLTPCLKFLLAAVPCARKLLPV